MDGLSIVWRLDSSIKKISMNALTHTHNDKQHTIQAIKQAIDTCGYYLANTGKLCSDQALDSMTQALGSRWKDMATQTIAPLPNPEFIAQSNDYIPPHNECAYTADPPRYLLLHCRENSVTGGDFYVVDSALVIQQLPQAIVALLYHMTFKVTLMPDNPATLSLLHQGEHGYYLQYTSIGHSNDWQTNQYYQPEPPFYQDYEQALPVLHQHLNHASFRLSHTWQQGDLLIIDNQRLMHGRDAFIGHGRRLDHIRIA